MCQKEWPVKFAKNDPGFSVLVQFILMFFSLMHLDDFPVLCFIDSSILRPGLSKPVPIWVTSCPESLGARCCPRCVGLCKCELCLCPLQLWMSSVAACPRKKNKQKKRMFTLILNPSNLPVYVCVCQKGPLEPEQTILVRCMCCSFVSSRMRTIRNETVLFSPVVPSLPAFTAPLPVLHQSTSCLPLRYSNYLKTEKSQRLTTVLCEMKDIH